MKTEWILENYGEKLAAFVQKTGDIFSGEEVLAHRQFFEVPSDKTGNLAQADGVVIAKYAFLPKDAMASGSVCSDSTPGTYIGIMENGKQVTIADSELTQDFQGRLRGVCNTGDDFVVPQPKDCVDPPENGFAKFVQVEQKETTTFRIHRWEVMRVRHWPERRTLRNRYNNDRGRIYPNERVRTFPRNLRACWLTGSRSTLKNLTLRRRLVKSLLLRCKP